MLKVPGIEQKVTTDYFLSCSLTNGAFMLEQYQHSVRSLIGNMFVVFFFYQVLDATSNEPWGPHGSLLADIAMATRN